MSTNLRDIVFTALNNAEDNGYDVRTIGPVSSIVEDLKSHAKELEDVAEEDIIPLVDAWLTATK